MVMIFFQLQEEVQSTNDSGSNKQVHIHSIYVLHYFVDFEPVSSKPLSFWTKKSSS